MFETIFECCSAFRKRVVRWALQKAEFLNLVFHRAVLAVQRLLVDSILPVLNGNDAHWSDSLSWPKRLKSDVAASTTQEYVRYSFLIR